MFLTRACVQNIFITALLYAASCKGQERATFPTKCVHNYILDISAGQHNPNAKAIVFEGVSYPPDKYFRNGNELFGCVCDVNVCVSKCCKEGHIRDNDTCTSGFPTPSMDIVFHGEGRPPKGHHYSVVTENHCNYFHMENDEQYHVYRNGTLYHHGMKHWLNMHEYCFAHYGPGMKLRAELCFSVEDEAAADNGGTDLIHIAGMVVSVPFLVVTLLVYFILPNKKLQTKCLMAYITCLMMAYIFLIYLNFNNNYSESECSGIGASCIYFFMATFCWMNVTCMDMYLTFSGKRYMRGNSSKWKRFGWYCLFANGTPIILLVIIFSLNSEETKNYWYSPRFGDGRCWLGHGVPTLLYFYGPMAVMILVNIGLFILTALSIRRTMVDNKKMLRSKESQCHYDSSRQDYVLYVKLFIAMGINWSMEFISAIVDWSLGDNKMSKVWILTDFCNAAYGIFIFFIFIVKKAIWIKLKQRYYIFMGKPNMAQPIGSNTSGYQMSQTERTNAEEATVAASNDNR